MMMMKVGVALHTIVNISAAVFFYNSDNPASFKGALTGGLLAASFGIYKMRQMVQMMKADPRDSVRIMMLGLLFRFFAMAIVFFAGHLLLKMDIIVFAVTFVFGVVVNIFAEVVYMGSVKKGKKL